MEITSLTTAATSLKIAKDAVEALIGMRDFNALASKLAPVNDQLLQAQQSLFVHAARMAELQEQLFAAQTELRELKQKASDREKYELFAIREGCFVYRLKETEQGQQVVPGTREPMHYLCQPCFDTQGHKSILQRRNLHWRCPVCQNAIATGDRETVMAFSTGPWP